MSGALLRLKRQYWNLISEHNRFIHWQWLLQELPGHYGMRLRARMYRKFFGSMGEDLEMFPSVRLRNVQNLHVGDHVQIGERVMMQAAGGIKIGDDSIIGPSVKIWSANHKFDDHTKSIIGQGYTYDEVVIGERVWIAANAFIMPGAKLGDGVIVSAGAVVGGKEIAPYKILAGNPARIIGTRLPKEEQEAS